MKTKSVYMDMRLWTLLMITLSFSSTSQNWLQLSDFLGTKRDDGVSFVINSRAFCGTGLDEGFNVTKDFYMFDMVTDTWTSVQGLPVGEERQYASAVTYNNQGYLFGGSNSGGSLNDLWKYNSQTNNWIELAALPDSGRAGSSSFVLEDELFIIGGKTTSGRILNEVWSYNFSTFLWDKKMNLPSAGLWRGMAFSNATSGYIGLGLDSNSVYNTQFYTYDKSNDNWTLNNALNLSERTYPGYCQLGDTVFVYGGYSSNGELINTLERIEIQNQNVSLLNNLPSFPRKGVMAFCSTNSFYLTTGVTLTNRVGETWKVSNILSIKESLDEEYLILFQEGNYVQVKLNDDTESIKLYNTIGELVASSSNSNQLSVVSLTQGVYFYTIIYNGILFRGKIFISN